MSRLDKSFFAREADVVARELVGKKIVHIVDGVEKSVIITETEAYCGESDTACHAHKGRTKRTELLYGEPGILYVYLCYGMHWLMNTVTGKVDDAQAVLIRAGEGAKGPGLLTKSISVNGSLNGADVTISDEIWIEDAPPCDIRTAPRVGINYASEYDKARELRFIKT